MLRICFGDMESDILVRFLGLNEKESRGPLTQGSQCLDSSPVTRLAMPPVCTESESQCLSTSEYLNSDGLQYKSMFLPLTIGNFSRLLFPPSPRPFRFRWAKNVVQFIHCPRSCPHYCLITSFHPLEHLLEQRRHQEDVNPQRGT